MNAENPYAAPSADLTAPGIEWMRSDLSGLGKTRTGLSLVYFGIVVSLVGVLSMLLVIIVPPVAILAIGLVFVGGLMMLVGPLFCLSVPQETGARGPIVSSVACQVVAWGLMIAAGFITDEFGQPNAVMRGAGNLFGFAGFGLFVLFMLKLATFIGRADIAKRAKSLLIAIAVTAALMGAMLVAVNINAVAGGIIGMIVMVLALVAFLSYAKTVNFLRKALSPEQAAAAA